MHLYELTEAYQNVQLLIELGTFTQEEVNKLLDTIKDSLDKKAGNIAYIIRDMDSDIEAIIAEEKRLSSRRAALQNKRNSYMQYLEDNFKNAGIDKVKTATHTISLQKNPPSVNILDSNLIPGDFITIIPADWKPDKKKILDAIKSGQEVPGAEMVQGQSLRIR